MFVVQYYLVSLQSEIWFNTLGFSLVPSENKLDIFKRAQIYHRTYQYQNALSWFIILISLKLVHILMYLLASFLSYFSCLNSFYAFSLYHGQTFTLNPLCLPLRNVLWVFLSLTYLLLLMPPCHPLFPWI